MALAATSLALALACTPDVQLGAPCVYDSECARGLACRLGRCREQCRSHVDCGDGAECLQVDGLRVCRLRDEARCGADECGVGLACADGECRLRCVSADDCVDGACVASSEGDVCVRDDSARDAGSPPSDASAPDAGIVTCGDGEPCAYGPCEAGACDDAADLALGWDHGCVRRVSGAVDCTGSNAGGQLAAPPTLGSRPTLATVEGLPAASELAAGQRHTCARDASGRVWCWGSLPGRGTQRVPTVVLDGPTRRVVAFDASTCVLRDADLVCWGRDQTGELGDAVVHADCGGDTSCSSAPVPVAGIDGARVVDVSLGAHHGCVVLDDGSARCWGADHRHQLGTGTTAPDTCDLYGEDIPCAQTPQLVATSEELVEISCGHLHTCARTREGRVLCWGSNDEGEVGDGTRVDVQLPTLLGGLDDVREIGTGAAFSCARRGNGTVWCWGTDYAGQLGTGGTERSTAPVQSMASDAASLTVGFGHACIRTSSGGVRCWGRDEIGQVGDGEANDAERVPVDVRLER